MPAKKKTDARIKALAVLMKDSLANSGINLPKDIAISTAGEILGALDIGDCRDGCKEGCKDGCKDGCQNVQKQT